MAQQVRPVSFVHHVVWDFVGNVYAPAALIGDVDRDGVRTCSAVPNPQLSSAQRRPRPLTRPTLVPAPPRPLVRPRAPRVEQRVCDRQHQRHARHLQGPRRAAAVEGLPQPRHGKAGVRDRDRHRAGLWDGRGHGAGQGWDRPGRDTAVAHDVPDSTRLLPHPDPCPSHPLSPRPRSRPLPGPRPLRCCYRDPRSAV